MREISRSKTTAAPLIAFLIPGGGHMLLGKSATGLFILLGVLTDIAAMIRLADVGGGKFGLFIVFLGLALPVLWFYSVFGALQLAAQLRQQHQHQQRQQHQQHQHQHQHQQHPQLSLDGLQNEAAVERHETLLPAILQGGALIGLSVILLLLVQTSVNLSGPIQAFGTYAPGLLLLTLALALVGRWKKRMFVMGRLTAAAALISVGGLLLWDEIEGRNDIRLLGQWWPVAFVLLGVEVVIYSLAYRRGSRRPAFDIGGAALAAVVAVTAFSYTQYAALPFRWLDEFKVNLTAANGFSDEKGFRYEKEAIREPFLPETSSIVINNTNGDVTVKKGNVDEIVVETVVWVDAAEQAEADDTAAKSVVDFKGGAKIEIKAQGHPYGTNGERKPRMNMVVTLPAASSYGTIPTPSPPPATDEQQDGPTASSGNSTVPGNSAMSGNSAMNQVQASDGTENETFPANMTSEYRDTPKPELFIGTVNGSISASNLVVSGALTIKVTSGEITLKQITGPVHGETKNGRITAAVIDGDVTLNTYNGDIEATDINGSFDASTLSGSIVLQRASKDVNAETKNGNIQIIEANEAVRAETLNGDINLVSSVVGGDWDIGSTIGEIDIFVPGQGDYTVNGSVTFGDILTDLPLVINKKTIRGTIGAGTYRINIDANSSIQVNDYKM